MVLAVARPHPLMSKHLLPQTLPLYLAFAATGVGVALPGAILPALLLRWHLGDEAAGRLFLLAFLGSSLGALLTRGPLRLTLAPGSLTTALAAAGLAITQPYAVNLLIFFFGLGLGVVMTSTSLLRQRQTAADPALLAREMLRLNFVWAAGACACPTLALHALRTGSLAPILGTLAAVFLAVAIWAIFTIPRSAPHSTPKAPGGYRSLLRLVPLPLILMTTLITGVESSAGGWLATYAHRGSLHLGATVEAPTCLWAGLLLSRLLWSLSTRRQDRILRISLIFMTFATLLLVAPAIATHGGALLLLAAFLLGFGIGPTYPLLLAAVARLQQDPAIFFLAGVGAATLPWLTGIVSAHSASLRAGFIVPLAATLLILLLSLLPSTSKSAWLRP